MAMKIRPISEGVVTDMPVRRLEGKDTIHVGMSKYAYGSEKVPGSRFLYTFGLGPCIAVIGHNPAKQLGFLAHTFGPDEAEAALVKAMGIKSTRIVLFGGNLKDHDSLDAVARMYLWLRTNAKMGLVIGQDLLRGENARSHMIGLDTKNGEILAPEGIIFDDARTAFAMMREAIDAMQASGIEYCADGIAPEKAFVKLARRR